MKFRQQFLNGYKLLGILFFLVFNTLYGATINFTGQPAKIELVERIKLPFYAWPATLLSYQVQLNGNQTSDLILVDSMGKQLPIQWSDIKKDSAVLNFLTDLPSGATRTFFLKKGTLEKFEPSNRLSVTLPKSESWWFSNHIAPAPFSNLKMADSQFAIGSGELHSPKLNIKKLTTEVLDDGVLFKKSQVTYTFENGGTYSVTMRFVNGYNFFEFDEKMVNLPLDTDIKLVMNWKHLPLKYRWAAGSDIFNECAERWPQIDQNILLADIPEDPHWMSTTIEDVSKEMYMKLAAYNGNTASELYPAVNFWEENGMELGLFMRDANRWSDPAYGIWQPTHNLAITFNYKNKELNWIFPITTGERSLGIDFAPASMGEKIIAEHVEKYNNWPNIKRNRRYDPNSRMRYNQLLGQLYGPQSLDIIKDWDLTYVGKLPKIQPELRKKFKNAEDLEKFILSEASFIMYPRGLNLWPGANSIDHRYFYGKLQEGYLEFANQLKPDAKARLDAILLYTAYLLTNDGMHPIRSSLAGCPNMAADGWTVPAHIAYLFPEHKMASEWRDYFQKYWQISTTFFTRPTVKTYESLGGRWAESFGIYNWAHLAPTMPAQITGFLVDDVNRIANDATALRGRWLVDSVTAPVINPQANWRADWRNGTPTPPDLTNAKPERQYPAIGAHNWGSSQVIPDTVKQLGYFLRNYDPMTAEAMMYLESKNWLENPNSTNWGNLFITPKVANNHGTDPELESSKYTGYGINLRHGVGTDKEVYLYLSQVDSGPNYRWGISGHGSTGTLYYVAGNKIWTGHETEDTGDHGANDIDGHTGFGVMKNQMFRSIGQNVLEAPLFDLDVAQKATLTSQKGEKSYSYPEYDSRGVLMVGGDYFLLRDSMRANVRNSRFSWFIPRNEEFPDFFFLNPASIRNDHWREIQTRAALGFHRDGAPIDRDLGHLVLVTHRKGEIKMPNMSSKALPFLEKIKLHDFSAVRKNPDPKGVFQVLTPESKDHVFWSQKPINYKLYGIDFAGTDGVVRRKNNGDVELAIFGKGDLAFDKIGIKIDDDNAAAALTHNSNGTITGRLVVSQSKNANVKFTFGNQGKLYANGLEVKSTEFAPGRYELEYTNNTPMPERARIIRTENQSQGAKVYFANANGATDYKLQYSQDNGKNWSDGAQGESSPLVISKLTNGEKVHLRLVALNQNIESKPSKLYPLYVSNLSPEHPDGLLLQLGDNQVKATWGECLGVTDYNLYRRQKGAKEWEKIYSGLAREYLDKVPDVVPAYRLAGSIDNPNPYQGKVYEYAVSASNLNGEGGKSEIRNTDPTSWLNWQVPVELKFRRQSEFTKPPYFKNFQTPPLFYPN